MAHMKSCPQTFTVGHHLFRTGVQPWDLPQPRSSERIFESLFDDTIQLQCPLAKGLVSASPGVYFAKKSVLVSILVENREQRHGWSPLSELIRLPNEQWTTFLVLKTILEDSCFRFVSRTGSLFWVATWINPNVFWDVALTHFFFLRGCWTSLMVSESHPEKFRFSQPPIHDPRRPGDMPGQGVRITAGLTLAGGLGLGLGLNNQFLWWISWDFMWFLGIITCMGWWFGWTLWESLNCQFLRKFRGIPGSLRGLVPGLRAESGAPCGDGGDELLRGAFRVATLLRAVLKGGHPWVAKGRESMGRTWNHWNSMAGSDWNGWITWYRKFLVRWWSSSLRNWSKKLYGKVGAGRCWKSHLLQTVGGSLWV